MDTFDGWRTARLATPPRPLRLVLATDAPERLVQAELLNASRQQLTAFNDVLFSALVAAEQAGHLRGFNVNLVGEVRTVRYDAFDLAQARGVVLGAVHAATYCARKT